MRRSDIKQLRRRLTCSAVRVWQQYRDVEQELNTLFVDVQNVEYNLAADKEEYHVQDHSEAAETHRYYRRELARMSTEAKILGDLATWYKSGHEQLNQMIREADTYISWELTD